MTPEITVRPVRESDLDSIASLEEEVWSNLDSLPLTKEDLAEWHKLKSPFFIVAEKDGVVCGYYFGKRTPFVLEDRHRFLDPTNANGHGSIPYEHVPDGESLYGMSITSNQRGAGKALYSEVRRLMRKLRIRYSVNYTRLSGLDTYLKSIENPTDGTLPYAMDEIALWYAHENAEKLGMRRWNECVPKPTLSLPIIETVDPVLAFHVRGTTFGLLGILPNYVIPDPESRNYGALILSESPHTD